MFRPCHNRVLVKLDLKEEKVVGGIIIPETVDKEKPVTGVVIVGNDTAVKGDRILFSKFGYDEFKKDNETYAVVSDTTILGIFDI